MATVVGKIDLTKHTLKLEHQIGSEIKSNWLDSQTAYGFRKRLESIVQAGSDLRALEGLLRQVQKEVRELKEKYGHRTAAL